MALCACNRRRGGVLASSSFALSANAAHLPQVRIVGQLASGQRDSWNGRSVRLDVLLAAGSAK